MASGNANLWVLDFLLEADGLDDTLIKHFHDVNASQFEELPPNTQARLMLRVLRDAPAQPTGIAEAALGALNMLKSLAEQQPGNFAPGANLEALKPSQVLLTEVKTELVLKSVRDGNQGEHPRLILDSFFVPPEQGAFLDPLELERRNEILEGLKGPEETQQLLAKYPVEHLNHTLLSFVATARAALGPNMLKLVEKDILEGLYDPHQAFQAPALNQAAQADGAVTTASCLPAQHGRGKGVRGAGTKRRRTKGATTTEEDAAGMLANMSQSNAVLAAAGGQDPLPDAVQAAQAAGQPVTGQPEQVMETSEGGTPRPFLQQAQMGAPAAPGDTPVSPNEAVKGNAKAPGQSGRRRNGRWNEDETNFLIRMVRELGKGKWKRILEQGGALFQNRSQVDLKDKWRNLERQGVVGPADLPPQPAAQMAGQQIGMPPGGLPQPQIGPDGHMLPLPGLGPNGEPAGEGLQVSQNQYAHYANAMIQHYAGQNMPIPQEIMQQLVQLNAAQQAAQQQVLPQPDLQEQQQVQVAEQDPSQPPQPEQVELPQPAQQQVQVVEQDPSHQQTQSEHYQAKVENV